MFIKVFNPARELLAHKLPNGQESQRELTAEEQNDVAGGQKRWG
jgi:hypothetical protein